MKCFGRMRSVGSSNNNSGYTVFCCLLKATNNTIDRIDAVRDNYLSLQLVPILECGNDDQVD